MLKKVPTTSSDHQKVWFAAWFQRMNADPIWRAKRLAMHKAYKQQRKKGAKQ